MIFNMITGGGGASAPRFGVAISSAGYNAKSLSFDGLLGEPQAFCVTLVPKDTNEKKSIGIGKGWFYITHFVYDGVGISVGVAGNNSGTFKLSASGNGYNAENNPYSFVYSSGTLIISRDSSREDYGTFCDDATSGMQYELLYIY